jgi:long-chain acyl-CoA synthetase
MSTARAASQRDLLPDRLAHHASTRPDDPALLARTASGDFTPISWQQYYARVRQMAAACLAVGLPVGGAVAILGDSRAEWVISTLGTFCAGGVAVGIYQTSTAEQTAYVLRHSDAVVAVIENLAQWRKVRPHLSSLPQLRRVVLMEGAAALPAEDQGLTSSLGGPLCQSWDDFLASGASSEAAVDARLASITPAQVAVVIYTSGTTGTPKGVMLTHQNLAWTTTCVLQLYPVDSSDIVVSYLPLSHIAEQMFSMYLPLTCGARVYFAGSTDRLRETLLVARPTLLLGVPRVWEKLQAALAAKLQQAKPIQRRVIAWARDVGQRAGAYRLDHGKPYGLLALEERVAERLLFRKLKTALGLDRLRIAVSAAAAIRKEVLEFFLSLQLPIYEAYGQSECSGPLSCCTTDPGGTRLGTVGRPLPGTTCQLGPDGEILLQGPNVFVGYFKDPAATAATLADGWLHTGDIGELDADGFLKVTDRKKDLFKTSGGKYVAPQPIEGQLRLIPGIAQSLVIGENRKYLTALLTLDPDRAPAFAKQQDLPTDLQALAVHPKFIASVQEHLDRINTNLARYETIKRFALLPNDFTIERDEMTPTQKLKRRVILQRYAAEIEAMYPPDDPSDR